jgi:hypothetical protein
LQDFWNSYFHLRLLTLYDYLKREPIRHWRDSLGERFLQIVANALPCRM